MPAGPASGITVRSLHAHGELRAAARLFEETWAPGDAARSPAAGGVPADLLRAFELSGNYVAGAFDAAGALVGACAGFAAVVPPGSPPELHSHVAAVAPSHRRTGVGLALKRHQRSWSLERGFAVVAWTFDPLVRRNAVFNLSRLGARAVRYLENVYGRLDDGINRGEESDRLAVEWQLEAPEVVAAAAGVPQVVDASGAPEWTDGPTAGPAAGPPSFRLTVPADIEQLRRVDPAAARAWRRRVREALGRTLAGGGTILGVDETGAYVVRQAARP